MSSSLGFRTGCDHIAERHVPRRTVIELSNAEDDVPVRKWCRWCGVHVPQGFLMNLLYAALFLTVPLLYHYMEYDYTDDMVRGGVIATSSVVALAVVLANNYQTWFNMVFFFHVALEVKALDTILQYAQADERSDTAEALAWTAFSIIIVHLVPFLFVDQASLLIFLAFAGVITNTSALVFIDSTQLLTVGFSSTVLLGASLCIAGRCGVRTSLLSSLRDALNTKSCIACLTYEA